MARATKEKSDASVLQLFLRVTHPSAMPARISEIFSLEPIHAVSAGTALNSKGRNVVHSETYWLAELPNRFASVDRAKAGEYRKMIASPSLDERRAAAQSLFPSYGEFLSVSSKQEMLELIGATPVEILLQPALRLLTLRQSNYRLLLEEGGVVTLIVQLPSNSSAETMPTIRVRPQLSRRLADLSVELELAW